MRRRIVNLTDDPSRGIAALRGTDVPAVFSDAVRIDLPGCTMLYISGKLAVDASGAVVGRTMGEQTRQVLESIKAVLAREGGTMDDVVRVRVYVSQLDPETLREIHAVRARYFREGNYPASTLVRVVQFVRDGALIEIDADAVIPTGAGRSRTARSRSRRRRSAGRASRRA
jgi:enamine deaminase RidA (YjgF/YER057c/UK114 family)